MIVFEEVSGWFLIAGGPVALLCGHILAVRVDFSGGPATCVGCSDGDVTVMRIIVTVMVVMMVMMMMMVMMVMTKQPKPESCIGQTTTATLRRRENDAILPNNHACTACPNNHACAACSMPCHRTSTAGSCTICPLASEGAMWVTARTPSMMYPSHLMFWFW